MARKRILIQEQHPKSRRYAILEDIAVSSGWLYLTEVDSLQIAADAWVYNRVPPVPLARVKEFRPDPPPGAVGYVREAACCRRPGQSQWSLIWSSDGESVAVVQDGGPVAYIVAGQKHGFSRNLIKSGPWGNPWSAEVYEAVFGR